MTSRIAALTLIAASTLAVAACGEVGGAKLTYSDTEKGKVTGIVLDGHSGDVVVTPATGTETKITRIIRNSTDPQMSYRMDGTELHLDTRCGPHCTVSYQIETPAGAAVHGQLTSGNVQLTGVGATDLTVTSGDVQIRNAAGVVKIRTNSGDVTVDGAKGGATLEATSGDIRATEISGGPVSAKVTSGDVTLGLTTVASVTAETTSGDVHLTVPTGKYNLTTHKGSGNINLTGVTDDATARASLVLRAGSGDITVTGA
jgi:DUF4097 and DUF4098 domain-containing protein YvlB